MLEPVTDAIRLSTLHQHVCGHVEWWPNYEPSNGFCRACKSDSPDASDWRPVYYSQEGGPDDSG